MASTKAIPLNEDTDVQQGCLSADPPFGVPRFGFDEEQLQSLRTFIAGSSKTFAPLSAWTQARDALRRHNCFGCHSRDGQGGEQIGEQLAKFLAEDRELNALKGTLTPPDLSMVGAKLLPHSLDLAVRGEAPVARPWLSVRMPRFDFEAAEAQAISSYFKEFDRVGTEESDEKNALKLGADVGISLLGRQGFGCLSCHVLDGKIPPGGEEETLGPDLSLAHRRMSRTYFERWLSDPQRIIPGTSMPQFLVPIPGVEGTIQEQLGAVWDALGDPKLAERSSTSSRQFLVRQGDRAQLVRDMVVPEATPRSYYPRGVAIGLKGDRSLLFDSDRMSWIQWWDGGFLSRTKQGRLWEWHPEGRNLWATPEELPPVLLRHDDGRLLFPELRRERFGSFEELAFEGNGVRLRYDLYLPGQPSLRVSEVIDPTADGWRRLVEVQNVPEGMTPVILAVAGMSWSMADDHRATHQTNPVEVQIEHPGTWIQAINDSILKHSVLVEMRKQQRGSWSGALRVMIW
ncbi:cytochrome c family protein [Tautonia rosea]|uniref:hypothetical protein n=1 Tax=Tautonia rosea TaxID=2728037 RepID=UPI001F20965B|nr:hypothetical protein [Tautonia rosea]